MIAVNMHEAKTRFSKLIRSIEKDGETILICRHGHPVAEIRALESASGSRLPGPDKQLAASIHYDPAEPLDEADLPEDLR